MEKSRIFTIRIGVLIYSIAATNSIGFNPKGHRSFVISLQSQLSHHNKAPSAPTLDEILSLLRGGEIENSNDTETNGEATIVDDNKTDTLSSDSAWDEEIKRLQMYMNSPQSWKCRNNSLTGENSDAYGSGEDILVLGSRSFEIDDDDEHVSESILYEPSVDDAALEQEDNALVHGSSCEDDLLHIQNETTDTIDEIDVLNGDMRKHGDKMNEDDEDQVKDAKIQEEVLEHVSSFDIQATTNNENPAEEISLNMLDVEVSSAPSKDDDVIEDATVDMQHPQIPQMITDQHTNNLVTANEDNSNSPLAVSQWKNTATSITAESNLVEIGLRKLRRKDGDHPSVPYVITRAMKRVLIEELGYEKDEVKAMRPDVAVVIVSENLKRPNITALPSRFYHEDIKPVLQVESVRDVINNKIQAFMRKINLKQSIVTLGSAVASYALLNILSKSNAAQVRPEDDSMHDNIRIDDMRNMKDIELIQEDREKDDVIPKHDLDRTWLDRLISMLTFYK